MVCCCLVPLITNCSFSRLQCLCYLTNWRCDESQHEECNEEGAHLKKQHSQKKTPSSYGPITTKQKLWEWQTMRATRTMRMWQSGQPGPGHGPRGWWQWMMMMMMTGRKKTMRGGTDREGEQDREGLRGGTTMIGGTMMTDNTTNQQHPHPPLTSNCLAGWKWGAMGWEDGARGNEGWGHGNWKNNDKRTRQMMAMVTRMRMGQQTMMGGRGERRGRKEPPWCGGKMMGTWEPNAPPSPWQHLQLHCEATACRVAMGSGWDGMARDIEENGGDIVCCFRSHFIFG